MSRAVPLIVAVILGGISAPFLSWWGTAIVVTVLWWSLETLTGAWVAPSRHEVPDAATVREPPPLAARRVCLPGRCFYEPRTRYTERHGLDWAERVYICQHCGQEPPRRVGR